MTCFHCVCPSSYVPTLENLGYVELQYSEPNVDVSFFDRTPPIMKTEVVTLVLDLDIAILKASFLPDSLNSNIITLSKSPVKLVICA